MIRRIASIATLSLITTTASAGFVASLGEPSVETAPRAYWTIVANERHLCVADEAGQHRCYNLADQARIPLIAVDYNDAKLAPFTE